MDHFSNKVFIIHNPLSGTRRTRKRFRKWLNLSTTAGLNFEHITVSKRTQIRVFLDNRIEDFPITIILAGGDGTLNVWLNETIKSHSAMLPHIRWCIFPCGTGNDWAHAQGISGDPIRWFENMRNSRIIDVDCGLIHYMENDHENKAYFINVAGAGLDGMIIKKMQSSRISGKLSYLYEAFRALLKKPVWNVELKIDGEREQVKSNMILAGLSSSFGGGIKLTPHCKKGILALSVVNNLGVWDMFRYLPYIFDGSVDKMSKIEMRHCHILEVKSLSNPHAFYLEADGEYIGSGQMQIRIAPLSLHFILPVK